MEKQQIELLEKLAYWLQYDGKGLTPKQQVKKFVKSTNIALTIPVSSLKLPSVCTGCGSLSTKVIDKKYLACCPDNHYISMEDYVKFSIYKPELRKR